MKNHSEKIINSIRRLDLYLLSENFRGYDPYDTLNSFIPFNKMGENLPVYAIQLQKRNPVNIRPLLRIKKEYNPKGLGLLLKAYAKLYQLEKDQVHLLSCKKIFKLLLDVKSVGYSGACWGYNFDWASPGSYLEKFTPSIVVTGFVVDGLIEYYKIVPSDELAELIISSSNFILKDLLLTETEEEICFLYTHKSKGCCYNASMVGAETLAKIHSLNNDSSLLYRAKKAINFVINKQKNDGSWYYSIDLKSGIERKQIDFHQGFILVSLHNYLTFSKDNDPKIVQSLKKGLEFYRKYQFKTNGVSLWRLPKEYPIDIHNQAQGIITFSELSDYKNEYLNFSKEIASWTITNMQDKKGYFYYRNYRFYKNKISYMRWSQAWMLLALVTLKSRLLIDKG